MLSLDFQVNATKVEHLYSLGFGEMVLDDMPDDGRLYLLDGCQAYTFANPNIWDVFRGEIRQKYFFSDHNKPIVQEFSPTTFNIAVHIRQCKNVTSSDSVTFQGTEPAFRCEISSETYVSIIDAVEKELAKHTSLPLNVVIYTNGHFAGSEQLRDLATTIMEDTDPLLSHHALITADVLIMAASSFSFSAGVVNDGIKVYYPPYYLPTPQSWFLFNMDACHLRILCISTRSIASCSGSKSGPLHLAYLKAQTRVVNEKLD